ncbi:hypothetical protein, partial [Micromonospora aurantiaca (nom. illeg.)]|uniref:hypothetical protein n=1 Tax=Micromonospora aurantiaca (nom. illeg.) TaxID=47850 RepID=UPI003F49CE27
MLAFGPDTPVLLPDYTEYRGNQRWILWPALQYRVVAPLVHEQRLNMFQNAVLGLARAGFRDKGEIGELLGLATELIDMVQTDLRHLDYLDRYGAVTSRGRAALSDGFLDPTRNIITYVYQDPFTGSLWPASTVRPEFASATWHTREQTTVQLRTAGAPLRVRALPVPVAADERLSTEPPDHEQIVEAVSRGEKTRRQGGKNRRWTSPPPDRVVSRVSMITSGQPVYIPVVLRLEKKTEGGVDSVSWLANSPFTGQSSTYLRRLIATRSQRWMPLQKRIEQFVGHRSDALLAEYDLIDVAIRRQIAEVLETRFTLRLREHPDLLELLTLLERDVRRIRRDNDRSAELSDVVRNSWRIHEAILRDLVARCPVSAPALDMISEPLWQHLGRCCTRLGLPFAQHVHLRAVDNKKK